MSKILFNVKNFFNVKNSLFLFNVKIFFNVKNSFSCQNNDRVQFQGPFIDGEVAAMNPLTYQYDSSTEQPVAVDSSSSDQLPNNNNNNITSTAYFKKERLLWTEWVCTRMIIIASICIMLFILLIRFIFGRYRKQASFVIRKIFVRRRTVDYTRVAYI